MNLGGVLTGTQLALERFLPRGSGHIVNLASTAAMVASPYGATYSATKHAVLGFTRALRGELRGSGVLTTVVLPGVIRTDMTGEFKTALGVRTVEPEAVANAVVAALRHGTPEIYVPREVALQGGSSRSCRRRSPTCCRGSAAPTASCTDPTIAGRPRDRTAHRPAWRTAQPYR